MIEPVAYRVEDFSETLGYRYSTLKPVTKNAEPLYTSEQLHPRVKMKQKQYDRLMWDKSHNNLSACLDYFLEHDGNNHFGLPSENLRGNLTQEDIARAWLNPEETIEIVPNMKWFVRSKNTTKSKIYEWLDEYEDNLIPLYTRGRKVPKTAVKFETEEEAEKWTNPLTEAVQLPVEE